MLGLAGIAEGIVQLMHGKSCFAIGAKTYDVLSLSRASSFSLFLGNDWPQFRVILLQFYKCHTRHAVRGQRFPDLDSHGVLRAVSLLPFAPLGQDPPEIWRDWYFVGYSSAKLGYPYFVSLDLPSFVRMLVT